MQVRILPESLMYTVSVQYQKFGMEPAIQLLPATDVHAARKMAREIAGFGYMLSGQEVHQYVLPKEVLNILIYEVEDDSA